MDAGTSVNPVGNVAPSDYARPAAAANPGGTAPDFPRAKAVNLPPNPASQLPPRRISANAYIARDITIDPQSREVIYRVIDTRTRQVLWQLPDAALLRNKAYAQTLTETSRRDPPKNQTDIKG